MEPREGLAVKYDSAVVHGLRVALNPVLMNAFSGRLRNTPFNSEVSTWCDRKGAHAHLNSHDKAQQPFWRTPLAMSQTCPRHLLLTAGHQ
eukprot:382377-Pleurochrysis_carterae.AAC.1